MEHPQVKLTKIDREILSSYQTMLDGLADYLGESFEFVLHSLENLDTSVIKIINGFHTNRKVGAPITDLALDMLDKIDQEKLPGYISYFSKNKFGEPLKAATIVIHGENRRIIGLLCINFYLNSPLLSVISGLVEHIENTEPPFHREEHFAESSEDIIIKTTEQVRQKVEADGAIPANLRNKEIIQILFSQGIFKFKSAVTVVAKALHISKNTVYLHLRNCK